MVLSEFKALMAEKFSSDLMIKDSEAMIDSILDSMQKSLLQRKRIEIRGFGSWRLKYMRPRIAHNPRSRQKLKTAGITLQKQWQV